MKRALPFVALVGALFGFTPSAHGQLLSDKDVDAAIVLGRANKANDLAVRCTAKSGASKLFNGGLIGVALDAAHPDGLYDVTIVDARGLIARAAWSATKASAPFTTADVPSDWRAPAVYSIATAKMPSEDGAADAIIPAAVTTIRITSYNPGGKDFIKEPETALTLTPQTWKNKTGATVDFGTGNRAIQT